MKKLHATAFAFLLTALICTPSFAQQNRTDERKPRQNGREDKGERRGNREASVFRTEVPAHRWDLILARPTKDSITMSVLSYEDAEGMIEFGVEKDQLDRESASAKLRNGEPASIVLGGLKPNTRYFYRFRFLADKARQFESSPVYSFTTARPQGAAFTFAVQADSHLDEGVDTDVYKRSLANVVAANPDFLVDLGDTFMTDKYPEYKSSAAQYLAQRYYFGLIGTTVPVFLTLGNHDGESGWRGGDGMFDWSNAMRRKYFPNPVPNDFYGGTKATAKLENYYSWQWGDAQFIVLDPFTYTTSRSRGDDNWNWTLGREQYDWLTATLAASRAKYKFVFIHHLVGGGDRVARGGAEASQFWEWGGKTFGMKDEFAERRPGFALPIHQLLVKYGVSAVFHGHDHLYVRQERDGVVYQEVPQPGHQRADNTRTAGEYGYLAGDIRGSSGELIVRVTADRAVVSYVRAFPESDRRGRRDGAVDAEYEIKPRKP